MVKVYEAVWEELSGRPDFHSVSRRSWMKTATCFTSRADRRAAHWYACTCREYHPKQSNGLTADTMFGDSMPVGVLEHQCSPNRT